MPEYIGIFAPELRLAIALGIGFLIGLERARSSLSGTGEMHYSGVRTFTLISLFGYCCAWFHQYGANGMLPLGLLVMGAFGLMEYKAKLAEGRTGWTSEVALLLVYTLGAMSMLAPVWLPLAIGIGGAFLLSEKREVESWVDRLNRSEFLAVLKFLIVTAIVLPVLPDENFTEYELNPARIWKIVILICTIGFAGYFLIRKFGGRYGLWLSGLLGGIVSSTAVSLAMGRIAKKAPKQGTAALQANLLASSMMYLRLLVLIGVFNAAYLSLLGWKLGLLACFGFAGAWALQWGSRPSVAKDDSEGALSNPFEFRPALIFAGLFVLLTVITRLVRDQAWEYGMGALALVVGLVDVDPFVLTMLEHQEAVQATASAIVIALMSNTLMKGLYFGMAAPEQRAAALARYGIWTGLHLPFAFWI
jgi:uncharacterized membrane protein (DUF4010 family)